MANKSQQSRTVLLSFFNAENQNEVVKNGFHTQLKCCHRVPGRLRLEWASGCHPVRAACSSRETAGAAAPASCPDCSSVSLLLCLGTSGESLAVSTLQPPFRPFLCVDEMPSEPPRSQAKQSQLTQPFLRGEMLQCPNDLHSRLLGSLQYVPVSLLLGNPEAGAVLRLWHHQCQVEGKAHLPHLSPPDAAQDTVSVPCGKGALLAPGQLGAHRDLQGFFCQAPFQPGSPARRLCWSLGLSLPRCRTLRFPWLNLLGLLPWQGRGLG